VIEIVGNDGFWSLCEETPKDGGYIVCGKGELSPVDVFPKLRLVSNDLA
jgi:hypothetical protein